MLLLWIIAFTSSLLAIILGSNTTRQKGNNYGIDNVLMRRSIYFNSSKPYAIGNVTHDASSFSLPSTLNPTLQLNKTVYKSDIIHNNKSTTDYGVGAANLHTPQVSDPCPLVLKYPSYSYPSHCYRHLYVYPCMVHKNFPNPPKPVMEFGVVYYAYTQDGCVTNKRFMPEVERNSFYVKSSDKQAKIALVTNCDVPQSTANLVDVIVPIHTSDVYQTDKKQWMTRMLYNAYLPFRYSFITDTHVYPCDNKSYSDILSKFKQSNIDISFSCRLNIIILAFGAGVLSKFGKNTFLFWKSTYEYQMKRKIFDDQYPMTATVMKYRSQFLKFGWLSSNYLFASHGITEKGRFSGPANCYRSSIVATGPIRWIHGKPYECELMNGKHGELVNKYRVYFCGGTCNTTLKGIHVITSESSLRKAVHPYEAPRLRWKRNKFRSSDSLFWDYY